MPKHYSAALPIAYIVLRILIVLNWFFGACILVLLVLMPTTDWILKSFGIADPAEARPLVIGLHAIAVIGLVAVALSHVVLTRLLAMVVTVRAGDPFVAANAYRLQAIAWALLALQVLGMVIGGIVEAISTPEHPVDINGNYSISGWLAVLLTFVLARVFAEGAVMREDLEGTV